MVMKITGGAESVWCKAETRNALHEAAKKQNMSRGSIITKALEYYLKRTGYLKTKKEKKK